MGTTTPYIATSRRRQTKAYAAADGGANHCKPQDGSLQERKRREIHLWTDEQFAEFSWAVNQLKSRPGTSYPTSYDSFPVVHPNGHRPNNGPLFLPWHRRFLHDFETRLQVEADNCELTVPYWNSHLEAGDIWGSVVWNANRYGGKVQYTPPSAATGWMEEFAIPNSEKCEDILDLGFTQIKNVDYCVTDGVAGGWDHPGGFGCTGKCVHRRPGSGRLNSFASVVAYLERTTKFESMNQWLDGQHAAMHASIVGGDMGNVNDSPIDPVFFLHHGLVDRLFGWWQEYHTVKGSTPTNTCDDCNRVLPFFNQQYTDWMGQFDTQRNCIPLPASNPTSCLSYVGHALEGSVTFSLAQAELGNGPGASVCEAHMEMLLQGSCREGIELDSIENTCPCPGAVLRDGCTNWIRSMTDMSQAEVDAKTKMCISTLEETVIHPEDSRPLTTAVTTEEKKLCIRCNFKCNGTPLPAGGESGVVKTVAEEAPGTVSSVDASFVDRLTALIR
jgi:tyrosinase